MSNGITNSDCMGLHTMISTSTRCTKCGMSKSEMREEADPFKKFESNLEPNTPSVLTEEQVEKIEKVYSESVSMGCVELPLAHFKNLIATIESLKEGLKVEDEKFSNSLNHMRYLQDNNTKLQQRVKELEKGIEALFFDGVDMGNRADIDIEAFDDLKKLLTKPESDCRDNDLTPEPPPHPDAETKRNCRYCKEDIITTSRGHKKHERECARGKGVAYNAVR